MNDRDGSHSDSSFRVSVFLLVVESRRQLAHKRVTSHAAATTAVAVGLAAAALAPQASSVCLVYSSTLSWAHCLQLESPRA